MFRSVSCSRRHPVRHWRASAGRARPQFQYQGKDLRHLKSAVKKNKERLTGIVSDHFSYPYGANNIYSRIAARLCTGSARGISHGINRDIIDLMHLNAVRIYNRLGIEPCLDMISECASNGGWLIFYTHDVSEKPSDFGCTPDQFKKCVHEVSNNKLPVLPVQKALNTILRN